MSNELVDILKNSVDDWNALRAAQPDATFDLSGAGFRKADLRGANLWNVDLRGANLRGANLEGVDLRGTDIRGASLRRASLSGANFWGLDLARVNLEDANLQGLDLQNVDLTGAILNDVDLQGLDLRCVQGLYFAYAPNMSSRGDTLYANWREDVLTFYAGCFAGTERELRALVNEKHGEDSQYHDAIDFIVKVANQDK